MNQKNLINKLNECTAKIGVIGLGYAGLPLALRFIRAGYQVLGFDIDQSKLEHLIQGKSYIGHIPSSLISNAIKFGFEATANFSKIQDVDALIICVPTPLNQYREPDLSYVKNTVDTVAKYIHAGQVVSLESTTYPGTTDEEVKPRLESKGLLVGQDIFLTYSPEREDPGNSDVLTKTIPKVCGGVTQACLEVGLALYRQIVDRVIPVSSVKTAEMTKLLENIHRAVNIGLVNEMKIVSDKMGIDIYEVIEAATTKPFGFTPYYPGPGLGGHCIPIDPFYLTWKAREYNMNTRFIELAGEVNRDMPGWVVGKVTDSLNNQSKALKGSKIIVLGIAYKKNVDDVRESPSIEIMKFLKEKQVKVSYSDPHVPVFPKMRNYSFGLSSVKITAESISAYDCVIVATNHDAFDYALIKQHAQLIVDTRGVYRQPAVNIVKA